jgi:hypothetical protein
MAAFPQLGYGYKSNTSHIVEDTEPTEEARAWWENCLTSDQRVQLIIKQHPGCDTGSGMLLFGLHVSYSKNPQKLFNKWIEQNKNK